MDMAFSTRSNITRAHRKAMDESIQILKQAVEDARIGSKDEMRSLRKLTQFVPDNMPAQETN